tara:strand:+ start:79 stop:1005 length:927 start_codon:yes stop_codon:yes gene_type:complete
VIKLKKAYTRVFNFLIHRYFELRFKKNKEVLAKNFENGRFAIEVFSKMGFGANLIWVLEILAFCEEKNLTPYIKFRNPSKRVGATSFSELVKVQPENSEKTSLKYAAISNFSELNLPNLWDYNARLTIECANFLINKYIKLNPEILRKVNTFELLNFKGHTVIGIHYRGTDKISEAPAVHYDAVLSVMQQGIKKSKNKLKFFIASDDQGFVDFVRNNIPESMLIIRSSKRSGNGKPIHISFRDYKAVNREALIDCLLLSKCSKLYKTASILSGCSVIFNPQLEVEMLNEPYPEYRYFPEKFLISKPKI